MSLWETIVGRVHHPAAKYVYAPVASEHVSGRKKGGEPAVAGRDYFRLWVSEMYLARDRDWYKTWHPAVHSLVRYSPSGRIRTVGKPCGRATVFNTDAVVVFPAYDEFDFDAAALTPGLAPEPDGAPEIEVFVKDDDKVRVFIDGPPGDDDFIIGTEGVNINGDNAVDLG
jgi:hypothetical protein